ncbi:MAG: protein kinase [Candidatus Melainabacteria bacterium]|nr:protein kinase [Candidatus Melainabacteria bacterium]
MYWPTPQDYNESVQMPEYSFADEKLAKGTPELTPIGLPKPVTGNFASVYRFETGQKLVAVKCFLRNVYDQQQRYQHLSQFMANNQIPYIVDFEYITKGIRVKTDWYPILKMDWVEGTAFDQYLRKHAGNRANIEKLLNQFAKVVRELKRIGIAHGDLQHGNIIVQPSDLRLVDYDGMFVPALKGESSNELGHPSYQHPQRSATDFSASLDDFSAWLIYSSLSILMIDPMLFRKYSGGDECILFRHADLKDPSNSRLFRELLNHPNLEVKARGQLIKRLAECPIGKIPAFAEQIPSLENIPKEVRAIEVGSVEKKSGLPDWMLPDDVTATASKPVSASAQKPFARPIPSHLRQAPRLPTQIKWPTIEQYDKATRSLLSSFKDQELCNSRPIVKLKINGKHGIVYQVSTKEKQFAIKCFIEELADRTRRYEEVAKLKHGPLGKYLVDFHYFEDGIKVDDHWFPCLKMSWQNGECLDQYACNMLGTDNKVAIDKLIGDFRKMSLDFLDNGVAHGDLEPSNILIDHSGAIKLVDYDAMFTPALKDLTCAEAGSPAYQHPLRNASHFGPWLDNFPAILIDSVLTAMAATSTSAQNPNWATYLQLVRPRSWSQGDPRSPVTRRSRLIKEMQMAKVENVPPLNAAIKL